MTAPKLKLCGLTRPADILAANVLRPEYIGFVFAPKSRRYLLPDAAAALRRRLAPGILAVGVFVDAPLDEAAALLETGVIDIAQLHGREDAAYCRALTARTQKPVWQAVRLKAGPDLAAAAQSPAQLVLLDSGAGGGQTLDWALAARCPRPFGLAGGLSPQNVAEAIRTARPALVDVSSGVETDGKKDPEKMRAFVQAVRSARP